MWRCIFVSNMNNELTESLLLQQDHGITHAPYKNELHFFNLVKNGDLKTLMEQNYSITDEGLGILSSNELHNLIYHFVICVALTTRFCLEGGMNSEVAYTLSDLYIRKADVITSKESLILLHRKMYLDFATRMNELKKSSHYSKHITNCLDYINNHLMSEISTQTISNALEMNKSYLSTLFRKETGMTISQYIEQKRIELACNMLSYSDYRYIDISNMLCFYSHSHFIQIFKKHKGMTPKQYRDRFHYNPFEKRLNEHS